jgi:threonine/homoserine/homoserine lactone efflux protein
MTIAFFVLYNHLHIRISAHLHIIPCISAHPQPIFTAMILLTFFLGLIANFIGYIPPGNINLTLVRITINRGLKQALQFITAFSCVEFFFTFFIMHAAKWLSAQVHLDVVIDWVMVALFLVLGTVTWLNRKKPPETKYSEHDSVKYGILLGFLNPMQVPFWMITGTYMITHEWIVYSNLDLVIFSVGSAGGAFLCLFLYAEFAKYIQSKFALSTRVINTAIAILFFAFAGYHVVKRIYLAVKPKQEIKRN